MEDESGNAVSPGVKAAVRGDLFSYWNDIRKSGEEPTNFTDLGLEWKEHFRKTFETKFSWLHLCDAQWKVDHLWINYFGSWKKSRNSKSKSPEPSNGQLQTTVAKANPLESVPNPNPQPIVNATPSPEDPKTPIPNAKQKERHIIEIQSSSEGSDISMGSKRGHEEPDDMDVVSKRQKGKDKEAVAPMNSTRARGAVRKRVARILKVSKPTLYSPEPCW
jgi:hypothetical protein